MRTRAGKSVVLFRSRRAGVLVTSAALIASILAGATAATAEEPVAEDPPPAVKVVKPADSDDDGKLDAPDTKSAVVGAAAAKQAVEDLSKRTESSTTVANADGSFTLTDYQVPVRIKRDGGWVDVDNTLVEQPDGSFRPKASPTDVVIGGGGSNDAGQMTLGDGRSVTVTWPKTLPAPSVDDNVATYKLSASTDLLMLVGGGGVSARLRLNSQPADDDPVFKFGLRTDDLSVKEDGKGGLALTGDDGKVVGQTAPLVAWDAKTDEAGDPLEKVALDADLDRTSISGDVATHDLSLTAPEGFLTDPDTQYPVTIDPDVRGLRANSDTWVQQGNSADHGANYDLRVGKQASNDAYPAISYIKWDLDQDRLPAGSTLVSAQMGLHQFWTGSCNATSVVVQPLSSNWAPSAVWTNKPNAYSQDYGYINDNRGSQCGNSGPVTVPATTWVNNWKANRDGAGGYPAYGLRIGVPAANETDLNFGRRFCSYQTGLNSNCPVGTEPYMSVTYNYPPDAPKLEVTLGSNPVTVYATTDDQNPEANLRVYVSVKRSGTEVWGTYANVPNPRTEVAVRVPYLPDGQYTVESQAIDDSGALSTVLPGKSFTIDTEFGSQSWFSATSHGLNDRSGVLVNNRTGGLAVQAGDISVNGLGLDLNATRFYNSQSVQSAAQGTGTALTTVMGKGWGLTIGPDVWMKGTPSRSFAGLQIPATYKYSGPGGTQFGTFVQKTNPSGTALLDDFTKPSGGVGADLSKSTTENGTTFTLKFRKSQLRYEFKTFGSSPDLYQTKIRDRSGNDINLGYSGTTPSGRPKLASITDSSGRAYSVTYTGNNIASVSEAAGLNPRTWSYTYDTTSSQVALRNTLTSYSVSQSGIPAATQTTNYTYQASTVTGAPLLTKIEDPAVAAGARTTTSIEYYGADANNDRVKTIRYMKDASSSNDFTWTYNRRNAQQACNTSGDDGSKYSTKVTDARGKDTAYCFRDASGTDKTRIRVKDAAGNTKTTSYTADKGTADVTTPSGEGISDGSTVATYGGGALTDQLTEVTEPRTAGDGSTGLAKTTFTYGHGGSSVAGGDYLPGSVKRPGGSCSSYEYDSNGRTTASYTGLTSPSSLTAECDKPAKSGSHRKYYSNGTVAASWDANAWDDNDTSDEPNDNRKTIYTYWAAGDPGAAPNSSGQLKTIRKPGGSCDAPRKLCTSYNYDDRGRVTTVTDGRGKVTTNAYDAMDRTVGTFFNGATSCNATNSNCVTYTYDAEGNLKTRTDSSGASTFTYDLLNRQTQQAVPGSTVLLGYDGNGNLTSHTLDEATDQVTTYTYSDANQLTGVTNSGLGIGGNKIDISPDQDGRVKQIRFPTANNLRANFDFKKSGKPLSSDVVTGTDPNLQTLRKYDYDYVLNVLGFEIEVGELQGKTVKIDNSSKTTTYRYNKDHLESSEVDGLPNYYYTHDGVGNVTSEASGGTTTYFGYDRAGQLCWRGQTDASANQKLNDTCQNGPAGSTNFNQDAAGNNTNTTSDPTVYNDDSQVASIAGINMGYLDRGNDLRTTAGPTTYVNSPLGVAAKKTGTDVTYYVRDPRGTILASYGAGGTLFYLSEVNGSVAALYNTNEVQVGSYTYSPYGKTTATGTAAQNNPFRYVGGIQDNDSTANGTVYKLGARYYDAQGHFTQPDPIVPGGGSYNYTEGDPINNSDPSGLYSISFGGTVCVGLCVGLDVSYDSETNQGGVTASGGVGAGIDTRLGGGTTSLNSGGVKTGFNPPDSVSCSTGPLSFTSKGDVSVNYAKGLSLSCTQLSGYTFGIGG